ncbi:metalloregulator ArsR/SmtB family transcription factor [Alteromonas sp. ASW11-130]|uniref:metalloregulator ArsR/SmtB family transcription factor n=1 Tax=Alteromonas sp. ASW11-130 TaxID=3015775 RepID=UPI0022424FD5|nr:metalloregulator ArsR/SmtB family transcription factor [Alteromonas sp. ASW11-130]MCW8091599.1 metalloregulator ArsR/SmtB family transcription factor [Alteromonas sp. ASW11-130]
MGFPLQFFKCLADDTRLKILLLIATREELCVCDFQSSLKLSQPKISRHLAELRRCELVQDERRGKWVFYRLHDQLPEWAHDVLKLTHYNCPEYLVETLKQLSPCCEND